MSFFTIVTSSRQEYKRDVYDTINDYEDDVNDYEGNDVTSCK